MKKFEADVGAFVKPTKNGPALTKNAKNEYSARIPFDQKQWLSVQAADQNWRLAVYLTLAGLGHLEVKTVYTPKPPPAQIQTASAAERNPVVSILIRDDQWLRLQGKFFEIRQRPPACKKELVEFCVQVASGHVKVKPAPIMAVELPSRADKRFAAKERVLEMMTAWLLLVGIPSQTTLKCLTGKEKSWDAVKAKYGDIP